MLQVQQSTVPVFNICLWTLKYIFDMGSVVFPFTVSYDFFFVAGGLLVSSLIFYRNKYKSILSDLFDNSATIYDTFTDNRYPEKENISIGFHLTAFASAIFFVSSFFNIANVFIDKKTTQASVQPSRGPHDI